MVRDVSQIFMQQRQNVIIPVVQRNTNVMSFQKVHDVRNRPEVSERRFKGNRRVIKCW